LTLSIIIVNYKSEQLILDALQSFLPDTAIDPEIIIVNNSPDQAPLQLVKANYPQVKLIQMPYNAGFSRANNEGIRQSAADIVLLLNPDTLAPKHAIDQCFTQFITTDDVACGVQLLNPDLTPQISGNFFMTGGLNNLLPLPVLGGFLKWLGSLTGVKKPNVADSNTRVKVDWINGAFLMVKKNAIEKAGLLDEDFFLYAEEIEWCSRLRKQGELCLFGAIKVIHLQGETANQQFGSSGKGYYNLYDRKGMQIMVSNFLRIRKQFGVGWFIFHLFIYLLEIPLICIGGLIGLLQKRPAISIAMCKGYIRNLGKLISLSSRIISNTPYFYKMN
jgi:GT2 family glycosyltransferase